MEFKEYQETNHQAKPKPNKKQKRKKENKEEECEELGMDYLKDDEFFDEIFEEK